MLRLRNTVEHVERQKNVPYHMPQRLSHIIIFQVFALLTGFSLFFLRMVYMYQVNPAPKILSRPSKAASIVRFDRERGREKVHRKQKKDTILSNYRCLYEALCLAKMVGNLKQKCYFIKTDMADSCKITDVPTDASFYCFSLLL